jgi:hypothetical protein
MILTFVALFACVLPLTLADEFERSLALAPDNRYTLFWRTTGNTENDEIIFQIQAKTRGWVGAGLSPNGGMKGSDIVVAGVRDSDGEPYLYDMHADCNCFPREDSQNNYNLIDGTQNATHTIVTFSRKINTCDKQDFPISNDTVRFIWAMHSEDAVSPQDFRKHEPNSRGTRSLLFFGEDLPSVQSLPPDVKTLEFRAKDVQIPSDYHTLYMCKTMKLPDMGKHYIVRHEPIIQKGHEAYLHHLILYHCSWNMAHMEGIQEPCFDRTETNFTQMYKCTTKFLAGWAVGSDGVQYPDGMGLSIMEKGESPFVMLEMHYDNGNLQHVPDLDNSGLRIYLTPTPQPKELGVLTFGMPVSSESMIIPPLEKRTTLYAYCDWHCTQNLPKDGVTLLSGLLHEHLLGSAVRVRQFRNGIELPNILRDDNYDFNYQTERYLPKATKLLPNDTVLVECDFNSQFRNRTTYGGFGTPTEMCFAFINYYPKQKGLTACISAPTAVTYAKALNAEYDNKMPVRYATKEKPTKKLSVEEYANAYNWKSPDSIERFNEAMRSGDYFQLCHGQHGETVEEDNAEDIEAEVEKEEQKAADAGNANRSKRATPERGGKFFTDIKMNLPQIPYHPATICRDPNRNTHQDAPTSHVGSGSVAAATTQAEHRLKAKPTTQLRKESEHTAPHYKGALAAALKREEYPRNGASSTKTIGQLLMVFVAILYSAKHLPL